MKKKPTRAQLKKQIRGHVKTWQKRLGLQNWTIRISWNEDEGYGTNISRVRYKDMILGFDLNRILNEGYWTRIEVLVVHEIFHAYTQRQHEVMQWLWNQFSELLLEHATSDLERMPIVTEMLKDGPDHIVEFD